MGSSKGWGGRRDGQTGRPPKANKKIRVGTLFLPPDIIAALADRAEDGETLIKAAQRIIIVVLASPSDAPR